MAITDQDLQILAARIRAYFEPALRDIAEELAIGIASSVGAKVKLLRPETTLDEIFNWIQSSESVMSSLDQVEWIMALEEELDFELSDEQAAKPQATTFRDLVLLRARARRAA